LTGEGFPKRFLVQAKLEGKSVKIFTALAERNRFGNQNSSGNNLRLYSNIIPMGRI
jgi:hypothetical protein